MLKKARLAVLLAAVLLSMYSASDAEDLASITGVASDSDAFSTALREIVTVGRLSDLRWPDFSGLQTDVEKFYTSAGYTPAWLSNNGPTPQAQTMIEVLEQADSKGLNATDYDGSRWSDRVARLRQAASPADQARFDAALTICAMRYISALRMGRVDPRHLTFDFNVARKKYDLALFLQELIHGENVRAELDRVEPPFKGYERTLQALQDYLELARQDDGEQLPVPAKTINPGDAYAGVPRLTHLLRLLGDLPGGVATESSSFYSGPLVAAVQHFQKRDGLTPDGRIGRATLKQLNVPLRFRVEQLRLALERWRWVPHQFPEPPIVVNIPEFRLRAYNKDSTIALTMRVIDGKSYHHKTPVFEKEMKYVVFRPYWNVPPSIQLSEIVPAIRKDRDYVANRDYEVMTPQGSVVTSGRISDEILQQLSAGTLRVRQKPGPSNALGLVKLIFPNEYNVYLHSTPAQELFSQSRRDFSHGCIRVEKPAELAAWVLRNNPGWSLERVRAAMESGKDNVQVHLAEPVPVLILYATAVVDEHNKVHFFDDIYGYDASLESLLAQGYPYPK
jgi:murein L,D-transpeptidase YcbB/YkuD